MKKIFLTSTFLFISVISLYGREMGHYMPGVAYIRDFAIPQVPGFYYEQYNVFYTTDEYKDKNGDSVDSITTDAGVIDIDTSVDTYAIASLFLYVTDYELFGGRYAFFAQPTVTKSSVSANVSGLNLDASLDTDNTGLTDLYIQPFFLGWYGDNYETSFGIAAYIPIGEYDADANDNIGLGFWTTQFQLAGYYYLDDQQAGALNLTATYETHSNKDGVDIRPGDHLTLEYGYTQMLDNQLSVGLSGYSQWQVEDDEGSGLALPPEKSQVHALGVEIGYWLTGSTNITFKYLQEYKAESRFEGDLFTVNLMHLPFNLFE